jgi:phosphohistidine phosphatase SixA
VQLYLVRHADAAPGQPDELRRLSNEGRAEARKLGERLAADGVHPDAVLTSPLLRARETGAEVARLTGVDVRVDDRLAPGATAEDVRGAIAGWGERVVVIGHQPDCSRIAAALTGGDEPTFPPAGMIVIDLAD